ncbi:HD-GYP domain-containing protein [Sphingomonas sp. XXL09]|uniref:HD-GYP domain-containing protein n=1 Tax=Sphingomonas sp. XXL09 TaxID=3457787 RepID=UPI00406BDA92
MTGGRGHNKLLRIDGRQVELGMYIHELHCSWLDNPFWRKSFLLTDVADRDGVRQSVPAVTIDLSKGRGLTLVKTTGRFLPAAEEHRDLPPAAVPKLIRRRPSNSLDRARASVEQATQAITDLFEEARLGRAIGVETLNTTVDDLADAMTRDAAAMITVTRLKDTDRYTYIHSVAVGALMMGLTRHLGYDEADVRVAGMAGLLHDIGKMAVPSAIVGKPGRLTPEELEVMRTHPARGHGTLTAIAELDPRILDVCRHHHEKVDGTGYPDALSAEALSPFARISAICDVYDAVTSIRAYKPAWSPHTALARMQACQGHFDPDLLRPFIVSLGIQPFGALVRLHSNRLGLVVADGDSPQAPIVRVFFDVERQCEFAPIDVPSAQDAIIRSERGEYWFGARWTAVHTAVMGDGAPLPDGVRQEARA